MKAAFVRHVLIALSLLVAAVPGRTQTKPLSIPIGGIEIRVGMPVEQVVSDLKQKSFTVQLEGSDAKLPLRAWWIWGPPAGEWANTFSVVWTQGNTVVGVEHRTAELASSYDVFNALFFAAEKVTEQGRNPCDIGPSTRYLSNGSTAGILLDCGGLRITLTRIEFTDKAGKRTTTYEAWESIGTIRTR